ncbi:MAG: hypothetical protein SGI86_06280 [Deltaproteobacteria bacterium]|nr:hypothetical protein [Deltaproteobacteria bacterium]
MPTSNPLGNEGSPTALAVLPGVLAAPSMGKRQPTWMVAREAGAAAVLALGLTVLISRNDPGFSFHPHPAWAAVLLLAARYGSRGLVSALLAVSAILILGSLFGLNVGDLLSVIASGSDLGAMTVSVLVAWVASVHESRSEALLGKLAELESRCANDNVVVPQLRAAAVALRARADRLHHSVSFLRAASVRLEGSDAVSGACAALELAIGRTGARGGVVQVAEQEILRTIAASGMIGETVGLSAGRAAGSENHRDGTAYAAFLSGKPMRAIDLPSIAPNDSDMAVPITSSQGNIIGIIALCGVPLDSLGNALLNDLMLIATWCSKPILARRFERRHTIVDIETATPAATRPTLQISAPSPTHPNTGVRADELDPQSQREKWS